jgi:hypothetical protein
VPNSSVVPTRPKAGQQLFSPRSRAIPQMLLAKSGNRRLRLSFVGSDTAARFQAGQSQTIDGVASCGRNCEQRFQRFRRSRVFLAGCRR